MVNDILKQNKQSWDAMADSWFGSTALPAYGCLIPTEYELKLFPSLQGKKVLDIGCGSGHSLNWCAEKGATELWGLDISTKQIENAKQFLKENGYAPKLFNTPFIQYMRSVGRQIYKRPSTLSLYILKGMVFSFFHGIIPLCVA